MGLTKSLSLWESLRMRATLWVWALPEAFVIQRRNLRDKAAQWIRTLIIGGGIILG